jgi:hypothetical protein
MDKNEKNIISDFYKKDERFKRDTKMPLFVGSVINLNGAPVPLGEGEFKHLSWANAEGIDLSLAHTGRRGNGLDLVGDTDEKRNLALFDKVLAAVSAGKTFPIKVKAIKDRVRSYDGVPNMVSYYFFTEGE